MLLRYESGNEIFPPGKYKSGLPHGALKPVSSVVPVWLYLCVINREIMFLVNIVITIRMNDENMTDDVDFHRLENFLDTLFMYVNDSSATCTMTIDTHPKAPATLAYLSVGLCFHFSHSN